MFVVPVQIAVTPVAAFGVHRAQAELGGHIPRDNNSSSKYRFTPSPRSLSTD